MMRVIGRTSWCDEGQKSGRLGAEEQVNLLNLRGDLATIHRGFQDVPLHPDQVIKCLQDLENALMASSYLEDKISGEGNYWTDRLPEPVRDVVRCALAFKPYLEARRGEIREIRARSRRPLTTR